MHIDGVEALADAEQEDADHDEGDQEAISGKVDQAGGLAVRLKDQNNYYVTEQTGSRTMSASIAS